MVLAVNTLYSSLPEHVALHHGDALDVLRTMGKNSVDAIVTDPPYFNVKAERWDKQWATVPQYLRWLRDIRNEWHRILKPNGSLYCFAGPRLAAKVELLISGRFNVLNAIRWEKSQGWAKRQCKKEQRAYFPSSETIIFAEHYGADNIAKGEAGYAAKCDELRGFVFEPLRAYLDGERERAGFTVRQVAEAFQKKSGSRTVTGMAGHWFGRVQWSLPTEENYAWLREMFAGDFLRREYEDLRREYEDLRRPFNATAERPHTDVWTFPVVSGYPGKHPCEKPLAMMEHIIAISTKPDSIVLDPFTGSGSTAIACIQTGRRFIGIEREKEYCDIAAKRIRMACA